MSAKPPANDAAWTGRWRPAVALLYALAALLSQALHEHGESGPCPNGPVAHVHGDDGLSWSTHPTGHDEPTSRVDEPCPACQGWTAHLDRPTSFAWVAAATASRPIVAVVVPPAAAPLPISPRGPPRA